MQSHQAGVDYIHLLIVINGFIEMFGKVCYQYCKGENTAASTGIVESIHNVFFVG